MSKLTKLCRKREDKIQSLSYAKTSEARIERMAMVSNGQWTQREGLPGEFHKPAGGLTARCGRSDAPSPRF